MMMTEMDIETSVYNVHLTRLIAREDFIKNRLDWELNDLPEAVQAAALKLPGQQVQWRLCYRKTVAIHIHVDNKNGEFHNTCH
jgi:hypothetical protein